MRNLRTGKLVRQRTQYPRTYVSVSPHLHFLTVSSQLQRISSVTVDFRAFVSETTFIRKYQFHVHVALFFHFFFATPPFSQKTPKSYYFNVSSQLQPISSVTVGFRAFCPKQLLSVNIRSTSTFHCFSKFRFLYAFFQEKHPKIHFFTGGFRYINKLGTIFP